MFLVLVAEIIFNNCKTMQKKTTMEKDLSKKISKNTSTIKASKVKNQKPKTKIKKTNATNTIIAINITLH